MQVTLNESAWNYLRGLAKTHRQVAWQPVKERYVRRVGCCVCCCLCVGLRGVVGFLAVVLLIMWLAVCDFYTVGCSFADAPVSVLYGLYR
jgi:hypothetical protein